MGEQGATEPRRGARVFGPASLAVLVVAIAWHAAPFPWPTNRFDTGIQLCGADLVRAGRTPYADFQTLYTPGAYYLKAAAFSVLGRTFDVHTGLDAVLMGLQAWTAWHLAARISGLRAVALVAAAAGLVFPYPYPSLVLGMTALIAAARPGHASVRRRAITAGVLAGVAGWFRQDFGAVAAVAAAATVATSRADDPPARRVGWAALTGACSAVTLATLLLAPLLRAPERVWEGLVTNPLATVAFRDSSAGFSGAAASEPVFLLVAVLAGLLGVLGVAAALAPRTVARAFHPQVDVPLFAGAAVLALYALRYMLLRTEVHHLVPAALLTTALAGAAFRGGRAMRALTVVTLVAASLAVALRARSDVSARVREWTGRRHADAESMGDVVPGARTLYLERAVAADWRRLLFTLRDLARPGAPFLSACTRHDRIHDQDLLLYFAMEQLPPVRDHHFDPGVTTRPEVQADIVDDAERAGVRVVVLYDARDASPPGAGDAPLDRWIAESFREWGPPIGRYEVRVR